jgi:NAD(P)-dependent dehydrogenase (short-subunit alcohol dehydrogenase family)
LKIGEHTFLVTGGASGLGAACVRRLVQLQARVVIADRDEKKGQSLAAELGREVRFVPVDVACEDDVRAAVRAANELSRGDGLRGLINCAGLVLAQKVIGKSGPHPLDQFAGLIGVNLTGTFNAIRLAADAMVGLLPADTGERGVIINTASVAAFEGQIGQAAYAASKGGVAAMTLPIARELAAHAIRVVTIAPGLFETPMITGLPDKAREALQQSTVYPPRLGRPEEFAGLVQEITQNPMLNGCVIRLDGAVRMAAR